MGFVDTFSAAMRIRNNISDKSNVRS